MSSLGFYPMRISGTRQFSKSEQRPTVYFPPKLHIQI
uniref:Uncharacterized protein n=1 Tax=Anguilla anguilla TaxID=7936 RepID=A0A0E9SM90_ANGAN